MSINTKPNTKPNAKASSRKLNVVNVVEQTQVNTADALVEQLMETTTAHIQNFTLNSIVPLVAVPVKRVRATRAKVADVDYDATESDVADAVFNKRKSKKSPAPAEVTDVAADSDVVAVVNKRKSKKSPAPAERKPKSNAMPVVEPFTPSPSPFMPNTPSLSTTHNDVEVEEVSVDGVIYYKDADGNLYDHATFEPITK
jgi:tyrosyl-tRNA synthetase